MKKINIQYTETINASQDKAWNVIGPNFVNVGQWGRGISKSWNNDELNPTIDGAPAGGRFCEVKGFGIMDERIVNYDSDNHRITWSAEGEKMPSFVQGLQNNLKVEKIDDNTSRVTTHITADLKGFKGWLMGGMVQKNFNKVIGGFVKDWKIYAETGEPSDFKKRELSK